MQTPRLPSPTITSTENRKSHNEAPSALPHSLLIYQHLLVSLTLFAEHATTNNLICLCYITVPVAIVSLVFI
jgi:hypothetical protein